MAPMLLFGVAMRTLSWLTVLFPLVALAETAVPLQTCRDARTALTANPSAAVSRCWDFESGTLTDAYFGDWTVNEFGTSSAFAQQPTYGDNVRVTRVGGAFRAGLDSIGGDYWDNPFPIGNQGNFWVGTYEQRTAASQPWGVIRGDAATGSITSPGFDINRTSLQFLVGGGCQQATVYVALQRWNPLMHLNPITGTCPSSGCGGWGQLTHPTTGQPFKATGRCDERLERVSFDLSGVQGVRARVLVMDNDTGPWGHINVDHIVLTNAAPVDLAGRNQPVWGFADTHAHPASHDVFKGTGRDGSGRLLDGNVFHGMPGGGLVGSSTPASLRAALGSCNAKHSPPANGDLQQASSTVLQTLGGAAFSDDEHETMLHQTGGYVGDGSGDFKGWPYWFSRGHQQMHITWLKRAYDGGQRLMIASQHNNELLGALMNENAAHPHVADYGALRRFPIYMRALAVANSGWLEVAQSPADARRIIRENKLAIILATEVDNLGDFCAGDFTETNEMNDNGFVSSTCSGCNPWPIVANTTYAGRCTRDDLAGWTRRIDHLYRLGYRLLTPIHLADNELGGTAVYSDLFNPSNLFLNGSFYSVALSSDVTARLSHENARPVWCQSSACALVSDWYAVFAFDAYTPAIQDVTIGGNYSPSLSPGLGHVNTRGLTGGGVRVIEEMKRRGMMIDVTHMSRLSRDRVFGRNGFESMSILNPSCNMANADCRRAAYPAVASHGPLAALGEGGRGSEASFVAEEVGFIRDVGGFISPGTGGAGSVRSVDAAAPRFLFPMPTLTNSTVTNNCDGSSRSWAQAYLYGLRVVGKGVAISTDFGLETETNPRFGGMGCYARGNNAVVKLGESSRSVGMVFEHTPGGTTLSPRPVTGSDSTSGGQRALQTVGLNYQHYAGSAPQWVTSNPATEKFQGVFDRSDYTTRLAASATLAGAPAGYRPFVTSTRAFTALSPTPLRASVTGDRTFDFNYDGLAHYGMLPDFFQDLRVVGLTQEQLGPLFGSAEAVIQTWERGCRMSDPSVSGAGCAP